MSDMPERLIAWPSSHNYQRVSLAGGRHNDAVEYVRTNAITAASATQHDAVQPTVKPLVWRSNGKGRVCADTPFGLYEVEHGRYGMRLLHGGSFMQDDLQGIEAAKAAAQADYEARILSVLDMQPTVSPELLATTNDVAALVDAAERVINSYWHSTDGVITGIYDLEAAIARVKGETK